MGRLNNEEWEKVCNRPKYTGIYEVMFQKGTPVKMFYSGLTKMAWVPLNYKDCVDEYNRQPTHWKWCEESYEQWNE